MTRIHLATALVRRGGSILLVASRYPNHAQPLWNLPGGRQQPGELLTETAVRELLEETGLHGNTCELCYVSESYDGETQITNVTFAVDAQGTPAAPVHERDHVAAVEWVPAAEIAKRIAVAVVREPLLAYLGEGTRYAGYAEAGVSIVFPD
jgi:8-oxo-dGTP pyrophosphatase MutT (NUDIX family)